MVGHRVPRSPLVGRANLHRTPRNNAKPLALTHENERGHAAAQRACIHRAVRRVPVFFFFQPGRIIRCSDSADDARQSKSAQRLHARVHAAQQRADCEHCVNNYLAWFQSQVTLLLRVWFGRHRTAVYATYAPALSQVLDRQPRPNKGQCIPRATAASCLRGQVRGYINCGRSDLEDAANYTTLCTMRAAAGCFVLVLVAGAALQFALSTSLTSRYT